MPRRLGWPLVAACCCVALVAAAFAGPNAFLRTGAVADADDSTTSSTDVPVTSSVREAPPSDDSALPKCNERLAGYQAVSADDVVLERAYVSNAATVFKYQRSIHTDQYDTVLDDEPRNETVFVCWFATTGYTFSPKVGDAPPDVDRVVEAITKSDEVLPLLRGKQAESAPVRPS